jgi:hypothetical protein
MIHVGLRAAAVHPTAIRTAQLKNDANFIFTVLSFSYAKAYRKKVAKLTGERYERERTLYLRIRGVQRWAQESWYSVEHREQHV